jgi:excisionase family DNA binding protein
MPRTRQVKQKDPAPSAPTLESLLNIKKLMECLDIKSRQTVYKLMEEDHLPFVKIGGQVKFIPSEVAKWVHKQHG